MYTICKGQHPNQIHLMTYYMNIYTSEKYAGNWRTIDFNIKKYGLIGKLTFKKDFGHKRCITLREISLYVYLYLGQFGVYSSKMSGRWFSDAITSNGNWNVNSSLNWFFIVAHFAHLFHKRNNLQQWSITWKR